MKNTKRTSNKLLIFTIIAAVVVIGVGLGVWRYVATRSVSSDPVSTKHFSGPTEQEKQETAAHKDELVGQIHDEQESESNDSGGQAQKSVTPIITDASQTGSAIRIAGYVPGIFEEGGDCTVVIERNGTKITKASKGFQNVSTTQCTPVTIDRSEFSATGDWQVTITYSSTTAKGVSQAQTLAVQ